MAHYYIDQTALENSFGAARIIELVDLDADGEVDAETIADAIERAESTVESYVARRYDLTAVRAAAPAVVVELSTDLALYELAKGRDAVLVGPGSEYEAIYDRAIARLKEIANGTTVLDVTSAIAEPTVVEMDANDRLFTRETMKGF
ncbi:MAG TPA: phage protein Gp36 family protein [Phycisphaerae bacterium]|nr:phage protein Gp36 family protein [Phycisphaerae bacterium]